MSHHHLQIIGGLIVDIFLLTAFGEDKAQSQDSPQKPKKKKSKKVAAVIDNDTATDSRASSDTDLTKKESGPKKKRSKKTV